MIEFARAVFNLEDTIADAAVEMVMVPFARKFVAARLARKFDLPQPVIFDERLDRAVDRRNAEPRQPRLSDL